MGLGSSDGTVNPFAAAGTPVIRELLGGPLTAELDGTATGMVFRALDATLGHQGLPQSATGQATLLTGSNCADLMDGHYGPWPGPTLKARLDRGTLFSEVVPSGSAALANAYPPAYFEALASGRARVNVPVHAAQAAGLKLADLSVYARGRAVAADLHGRYFATLDPAIEPLTPARAGERLAGIAARHLFTFFDFWPSDRVGHRGSFAEAVELVEQLDEFLGGVIAALDGITLLVTSDHGNLENKATRSHTRAPVPLLALGPAAQAFAGCASLLDVAPAIRRALALPG